MLTVGEILKKTREEKKLTLKSIEKEIKIREKFLQSIEENRWDSFSSKIYITGIIKNYAEFLGIDPHKAQAYFLRDYERKEEVKFKKKISSKYLTPETKKFFVVGISFVMILFLGYFGYQLKLYFSPPKVSIISPKETSFKNENKIKITGKVDRDVIVNIFNDRIYQNKEGIFEYEFPLKQGKNILTIEVIGANGRKTTLKKEYFKD